MDPENKDTPEYIKELIKAIKRGDITPHPGGVGHIHVYHDSDCSIFTGGACDCTPEIIYEVKGKDGQ